MFKKIKVPTLRGEKISLRMWNRQDAEDLYEYAKDPRVGPAAGWEPHDSIGDSRIIINSVYQTRVDWAIVDNETDKAIGNIGFDKDVIRQNVRSKELGYSLSADYWGQGIATEAVAMAVKYGIEYMELDCITMRISPDNIASRRVAEKTGFAFEGILRHGHKKYNGNIEDIACYSMLESDYVRRLNSEQDQIQENKQN